MKRITDPAQLAATQQRIVDKLGVLERVLEPTLNREMTPDEISEWANALCLFAGCQIGMVHVRLGLAPGVDRRVAEALRQYALEGMQSRRRLVRK